MNKPAVGWPDVDHSRTPLDWSLPTNLMPPVAAGWSPGTRRNASEAESILSEAVAWWDPTVSGFRDGDRWLRNSGTAGGLLDLRLGSSVVANTNDPKWLGAEDVGYVYLPGVLNNYMTVPDEAALRITGDLDIRMRASWDAFAGSATTFLGKTTLAQPGYQLYRTGSGEYRLYWSPDGIGFLNAATTVAVTLDAGAWLRVTLDVDNGASGRDIKFYRSTDGSTWTQIGATVTQAGVTSIYAGTQPVYFYARSDGYDFGIGKFYRAIIKNGIDGTTVLDVDCDAITSGSATSFTATTGQTVTINRSTSGRKSVAVPAKRLGGRACFLFGTDDYMEVVDNWQHQLLNFGQGDSFTVLIVSRQWATPLNNARLIAKSTDATDAGWLLRNSGTTVGRVLVYGDGTTTNTITGPTGTLGAMAFIAAVVDGSTRTLRFTDTTTTTTSTLANTTSGSRSPQVLRIARASSGAANYSDSEFRAAAVLRRPLTAREISVLSTYYSGG